MMEESPKGIQVQIELSKQPPTTLRLEPIIQTQFQPPTPAIVIQLYTVMEENFTVAVRLEKETKPSQKLPYSQLRIQPRCK